MADPLGPPTNRNDHVASRDFFYRMSGEGTRKAGSPLLMYYRWLMRNNNSRPHHLRAKYWRPSLSNHELERIRYELSNHTTWLNLFQQNVNVLYPHVPLPRPPGARAKPSNLTSMRRWLEKTYGYPKGCRGLGSPYFQYVIDRMEIDSTRDLTLLDSLEAAECERIDALYIFSTNTSSTGLIYYDTPEISRWPYHWEMRRGRPRGAPNRQPKTTAFQARNKRATSTYLHKLRNHRRLYQGRLTAPDLDLLLALCSLKPRSHLFKSPLGSGGSRILISDGPSCSSFKFEVLQLDLY